MLTLSPETPLSRRHVSGFKASLLMSFIYFPVVAWKVDVFDFDDSLPFWVFRLFAFAISSYLLMAVLICAFVTPVVLAAEWIASHFRARRFRVELILIFVVSCEILMLLSWFTYQYEVENGLSPAGRGAHYLLGATLAWLAVTPLFLVYWWAAKAHQLGYTLGQMLTPENAVEQFHLLNHPPDELAREH